jgi:3',5'-cyclic AMP phosphodiesterase CpdA
MTPSLAHLTDIHFGGENEGAVAAALEELRREPPDVIMITGDVTCVGAAHEFDRAASWIRALPEPVVSTPGNHDTPYVGPGEIIERLAAPFRRWERRFGPPDSAWRGPQMAIASINTARGAQLRLNWSKGAISQRQAEEAVRVLADRPASSLAIVACHHPLVEMIGGPMTARVRGGEAAARRFCEAKVDLILTGHIHAPFAMPLPYGDGMTYAVGAGTLSLRERGVPASYNRVDVGDTAVTVTTRAWTGSHYEPWRTWSLPRRRA